MITKLYPFSVYKYLRLNFLNKNYLKSKTSFVKTKSSKVLEIVKSIERDGFYIYENYYDKEYIDEISQILAPELDKLDKPLLESDGNLKWIKKNEKAVIKKYGYSRLYNLMGLSRNLDNHVNNNFFTEVASNYFRRNCFMYHSVAQKDTFVENGAGLVWHIDDYKPRFKVFCYLHDVRIEHGPLSLFKGSHIVDRFKMGKYHQMFAGEYLKGSMITDNEIKKFIAPRFKKIDFLANKGTIILVDVNTVHKGLPTLKNMNRYAIALYYSP